MRPETAPLRLAARARGVSLVEVVISLVLAGILAVSMWGAYNVLLRYSADPLVSRQMLIAGQSLLREIDLQPLPGTATAATGLAGRTGFASIADYNGLTMTSFTDAEGAPVSGLEGYGARVGVTSQTVTGVPGYWISVDVSGPGGQTLALGVWRAAR